MADRWHIVTPFKVSSDRRFKQAAEEAFPWNRLFRRNQAGYVFCVEERWGDEGPQLDDIQAFLQKHLPPKEYALFRIEHWTEEDLGDRVQALRSATRRRVTRKSMRIA